MSENLDEFHQAATPSSKLKVLLVSKYMSAWAWIVFNAVKSKPSFQGLNITDLFCGPGRYGDGQPGSLIAFLDEMFSDENRRKVLSNIHITLNDGNQDHAEKMKKELQCHGSSSLLASWKVTSKKIDSEQSFQSLVKVQSHGLLFLDPYGYKGIHLNRLCEFAKCPYNDVIWFVNSLRMQMAAHNPILSPLVTNVTSQEIVRDFVSQPKVTNENSADAFIRQLAQDIVAKGIPYFIPVGFRSGNSDRISHHVAFITKHRTGANAIVDTIWDKVRPRLNDHGGTKFVFVPTRAQPPLMNSVMYQDHAEKEVLKKILDSRHSFGGKTVIHICQSLLDSDLVPAKIVKNAIKDIVERGEGRLERAKKIRKSTAPDDATLFF